MSNNLLFLTISALTHVKLVEDTLSFYPDASPLVYIKLAPRGRIFPSTLAASEKRTGFFFADYHKSCPFFLTRVNFHAKDIYMIREAYKVRCHSCELGELVLWTQ